jgi:hypothetical protein
MRGALSRNEPVGCTNTISLHGGGFHYTTGVTVTGRRMTPKNSEVDRRIALPFGPQHARNSVGTRCCFDEAVEAAESVASTHQRLVDPRSNRERSCCPPHAAEPTPDLRRRRSTRLDCGHVNLLALRRVPASVEELEDMDEEQLERLVAQGRQQRQGLHDHGELDRRQDGAPEYGRAWQAAWLRLSGVTTRPPAGRAGRRA